MSAHTPGPWTCDVVVDDVRARPDNTIQPTYALNVKGHAWPILSSREAHANARLIAAAPELLAALKYVLAGELDRDRRARAEAVISKAEDGEGISLKWLTGTTLLDPQGD